MSRAFVREDDFKEQAPLRPLPTLPAGVKNYITKEGAEALRAEVNRLDAERSRLAGANDRVMLGNLDQRIARLEEILGSVTVVEPAAAEEVRFGANVTVKYPSGDVEVFRVVGVNEIDLERNFISWQSPLAKALMNSKAGDVVRFKAPAGEQRLEVLKVEY
ncbi:MAG TPA: GreA/GreB family elongation factor [Verrucomicrobiae bacterium]|nr:GreA/GreB family elongation factor [Verrucomicrobiae bacterium]